MQIFTHLFLSALLLLGGNGLAQPILTEYSTPTQASFRGISAVSASCCWMSGSDGTVVRTINGGKSWQICSPDGYEKYDFRDIEAIARDTAIILSAGFPAVICRTTDGGKNWKEVYRNETEGIFFDAMDFWDKSRGMAFSDAIENKLTVIQTEDGGEHWKEINKEILPEVLYKQGGFAASGSCLQTFGDSSVIIGLGGKEATYLLSENSGKSWMKGVIPLDKGAPSKGIFSFYFLNEQIGFCTGGDYRGDSLSVQTAAQSIDGGKSWKIIENPHVNGFYRSAIDGWDAETLITVSRNGSSVYFNGKWKLYPWNFFAIDCVDSSHTCWCSGDRGRVGKIIIE